MELSVTDPLFEADNLWSKKALKEIVAAAESNGLTRLTVEDVTVLMNHNPHRGNKKTELLAGFGIPGSLLLGHVALETVIEQDPNLLPTFGRLPGFAHRALTNLAELPFFDQSEPASAAFRDHAPNMILFAAGSYLGLEAARLVSNRSFHQRAKAAKADLARSYSEGTISWSIEPGSSVAFIGHGDPLARKIAATKPREILQISHIPVDGPWTKLPKTATFDETIQALDRANIGNAGELLFFPTKPTQEFLPGDGDHDISVDRMVNYILAADVYREGLGYDKLPVVIIGSKYQSETYADTTHSRVQNGNERCVTLEQRMSTLSEQRDSEIQIIDPTELIIDRIIELAQGRRLNLSGTEFSVTQYAEKFFSTTFGRHEPKNDDAVRIIYNNNDYPTVSDASAEDICVVLDPTQKQALMYRGIPEDRILVVSDEVLRIAGPLIAQS